MSDLERPKSEHPIHLDLLSKIYDMGKFYDGFAMHIQSQIPPSFLQVGICVGAFSEERSVCAFFL